MNRSHLIKNLLIENPKLTHKELSAKIPGVSSVEIALGFFYSGQREEAEKTLDICGSQDSDDIAEYLQLDNFVFFFNQIDKKNLQIDMLKKNYSLFLNLEESEQFKLIDHVSYDYSDFIDLFDFIYFVNKKIPPFELAKEFLELLNLDELSENTLLACENLISYYPNLITVNSIKLVSLAKMDNSFGSRLLINCTSNLLLEDKLLIAKLLIEENYLPSITELISKDIFNDKELTQIFINNSGLIKSRTDLLESLNRIPTQIIELYTSNKISDISFHEAKTILIQGGLSKENNDYFLSIIHNSASDCVDILIEDVFLDEVSYKQTLLAILKKNPHEICEILANSSKIKNDPALIDFIIENIPSKEAFTASNIVSTCRFLTESHILKLAKIACCEESSCLNFAYGRSDLSPNVFELLAIGLMDSIKDLSIVGKFLTQARGRLSKESLLRLHKLAVKDPFSSVELIRSNSTDFPREELIAVISQSSRAILLLANTTKNISNVEYSLFIKTMSKEDKITAYSFLSSCAGFFDDKNWIDSASLFDPEILDLKLITRHLNVIPVEIKSKLLLHLLSQKSSRLEDVVSIPYLDYSTFKIIYSSVNKDELALVKHFIPKTLLDQLNLDNDLTSNRSLAEFAFKSFLTKEEELVLIGIVYKDLKKINEIFFLKINEILSITKQKELLLKLTQNNPELSLKYFDLGAILGIQDELTKNILMSPKESLELLKKKIVFEEIIVSKLIDCALLTYEISDLLTINLPDNQKLIILKSFYNENQKKLNSKITSQILASTQDIDLLKFALINGNFNEQQALDIMKSYIVNLDSELISILMKKIVSIDGIIQLFYNPAILNKLDNDIIFALITQITQNGKKAEKIVYYLTGSDSSPLDNLSAEVKKVVLTYLVKNNLILDSNYFFKKNPWNSMNNEIKELFFEKFKDNSSLAWDCFLINKANLSDLDKPRLFSYFNDYSNLKGLLLGDIISYYPQGVSAVVQYFIQNKEYLTKDYVLKIQDINIAQFKDEIVFFHELDFKVQELIKEKINKINDLPKSLIGYFNLIENSFTSIAGKTIELRKFNYKIVDIKSDKYTPLIEAILKFKPIHSLKSELINENGNLVLKLDLSGFKKPVAPKVINQVLNSKKEDVLSQFDNLIKINSSRPFGIEIEFASKLSRAKIGRSLAAKKINTLIYPDTTGEIPDNAIKFSSWEVKYDLSIKGRELGYEHSVEVVSPKLYGEEGITEVKHVLSLVNGLATKENLVDPYLTSEEAGVALHVHHDISDLIALDDEIRNLNQIIDQELYKLQEPIYNLCASHRQKNEYCQRLKIINGLEDVWDNSVKRGGFYMEYFNNPYNKENSKKTIEFRMKESTLNSEEVIRWVKLTHQVVDSIADKIKGNLERAKSGIAKTFEALELEKTVQVINNNADIDSLNDFYQALEFSKLLTEESS